MRKRLPLAALLLTLATLTAHADQGGAAIRDYSQRQYCAGHPDANGCVRPRPCCEQCSPAGR
jgi:hypothetical protein